MVEPRHSLDAGNSEFGSSVLASMCLKSIFSDVAGNRLLGYSDLQSFARAAWIPIWEMQCFALLDGQRVLVPPRRVWLPAPD